MHQGVSIESLRKAVVDPVTASKVLALRGQHSFDDDDSAWALDQVLRRLRALWPDMEVNDLALPSYKILANVSNDPDDKLYSPYDQFPLVQELLDKADVIVVATHQHAGFPSADLVRLFERLADLAHKRRNEGNFKPLLDRKPFGVITSGGFGAYPAAVNTAGAIATFGCVLVRHGLAFWDGYVKGAMAKDKDFAAALDLVADNIGDTYTAFKR